MFPLINKKLNVRKCVLTMQNSLFYRELKDSVELIRIGRVFTGHPQIQSGILEVVNPEFPATLHLPKKWIWTDEWYNFSEPKSDNLKVILKVDESTYNTTLGYGEPISGMGDFHPILPGTREFDGGRSFYSALDHNPETYEDERHLELIYGGIYWTATGKGNMKNP